MAEFEETNREMNYRQSTQDYFSDTSEDFDAAEFIEHNYQRNPQRIVESSSDDESYHSNDDHDEDAADSSSGDDDNSEETEDDDDTEDDDVGQQRHFFSSKKMMIDLPFIAKRTFHARDHLISIIAMSVRHNLTYEATLHMLQWIASTHWKSGLPTTKKAL